MIKHIVCFKLKNPNEALLNETAQLLRSMKGKVPMVVDLTVGIDFLHSDRSYDLILEVILNDRKDLVAYQNDEYHCNVVKKHMHAIRETSVSVDFELE